ncbi:G-protein-coupled receptor family protein [Cavenderia fasciculata]|uniref:G-protein-coupled receptor family protein n=1 Tax=Cavenderia fasciculata TaxID=261658 RepID=F4Q8C6_CACFS|nr:G-protein-coupled receptor family protein [Cavenderia fasciculata]EGG16026.1 G-protein-coupled receptor family protein [Cavenderia fasciculata]|eukprot:XP_004352351.1 G-protein-coupled receptor family protein [Cavenderia fasciculata]
MVLLLAAKYNNHLGVEKYYKYYHIISWGVPFVLISVLFILRIVKHADCLTYSELYPHLLFFIPLVGCFIYNIVVSVLVTRSLKRQGVSKRIMFDDSDSDDDDSVSSDDEGSSFSSSSVLLSWIPFLNKKSSSTQDIPSNISNHNRNNNNNRPNNNNNNNRTHSIPSKSSSSSTSTKNIIQPIPKNNKVIKKNNNNHKIIVSNSIEDIRYLDESTPKLVRTSIYYLMSFAICWIWPMIVVFFLTLETKNPLQFIFLTLSYIWVPLQGFLNALIYGLHDILWSRLKDRVRSHWGDITIISPSTLDPMQSKPLIDSFYEDEDGDEDKFIFKHQYDHSDFGDIESPTIDTTSIKYSIN